MMVCELDERMPSSELTAWLAYHKLEPFGAERDNFHAAQIAASNVNLHLKKGARPVQLEAFMYVDKGTEKLKKANSFYQGIKGRVKKNGN